MSKSRVCGRFPLVPPLVFVLALVNAQLAVTADDADAEELADEVDAEGVEIEEVELLGVELPGRPWFDMLVFGGEGETAVAAARRRLERVLKERIGDIASDVDRGAASLAALANLRELVLDDTLIGDEGLARLTLLSRLERLDLGGTRVTGAGLANLRSLTSLRSLDLTRTKVEAKAAAELKKALPKLAVFR